jgi:hypothetical protein
MSTTQLTGAVNRRCTKISSIGSGEMLDGSVNLANGHWDQGAIKRNKQDCRSVYA